VNREFKHGPFENVRENWKGNEEWTIHRNWKHWTHD
jgi:hypothetical protein